MNKSEKLIPSSQIKSQTITGSTKKVLNRSKSLDYSAYTKPVMIKYSSLNDLKKSKLEQAGNKIYFKQRLQPTKILTQLKPNENFNTNQIFKGRDSLVSSESNFSTLLAVPAIFSQSKEANRFPCSISIMDLIITILRYKETSETLIDLLIPSALTRENLKFFQAKFNCINNYYQV